MGARLNGQGEDRQKIIGQKTSLRRPDQFNYEVILTTDDPDGHGFLTTKQPRHKTGTGIGTAKHAKMGRRTSKH
jgi:hypothetical protein